MVFNFYINKEQSETKSEELESILRRIEEHFQEWYEFYKFYSRHASPPNKHADKIQDIFNDLRSEFVNIVEQYNNDINHFADIKEDKPDSFEEAVINQMKKAIETKETKDNSSFSMYN